MIVEEWVRTAKPAQPPAENSWYAEGDKAQRKRWRRVRRQRTDGGTLEDSATGRAEHLIPGTAIRILAHERMDEADNREARAGRVANWGQATLRVPAEDLSGEMQAAHGVGSGNKLHAARRHMEDIRSSCFIEHVRPLQEARKRLTIGAVTDETEA